MKSPHRLHARLLPPLLLAILTTSLTGCFTEYDNTDLDTGYTSDTNLIPDTSADTDTSTDTSADTDADNTSVTCEPQCAPDQVCIDAHCIDLTKLALGGHHSCAIIPDGEVKCWGKNNLGQLGQGTTDKLPHHEPIPVPMDAPHKRAAIYAGQLHTCITTYAPLDQAIGDEAWCWGQHHAISSEDDLSATDPTPVQVPAVTQTGRHIIQLAHGISHSCSLFHNGLVRCWGNNIFAQLGEADTESRKRLDPVDILGISQAKHITAGGDFSCALVSENKTNVVYCWGDNRFAKLARPFQTLELSRKPLRIPEITNVQTVHAGQHHACAIVGDQRALHCWGYNDDGQLGTGDFWTAETPTPPKGSLTNIKQLALGNSFTCALLNSAQVACTGSNLSGQLARPRSSTTSKYNTFEIIPDLNNVHSITAGDTHICAVHNNNEISCWGSNEEGQSGTKNTPTLHIPTPLSLF